MIWDESKTLSSDDLTQMLTSNSVVFCGELATPITVTLTPQTLAMLAGTNIIQSTEADDLSLTYKATN